LAGTVTFILPVGRLEDGSGVTLIEGSAGSSPVEGALTPLMIE
jgi:hypothetical protein